MNRLLRLYISSAWPVQTAACEWQLCDDSGNQLQLGCSEPRHWPDAERCEVILGAAQCLVLKAQLPKGVRTRNTEVLAYALEEQLIGETDDEHFVIGDTPAKADSEATTLPTPVWVISRTRLRTLFNVLRPLGRVPQRLVSEIQLAPRRSGWTVCLYGTQQVTAGFVRLAAEDGFAFDLPDMTAPPLELRLAVQSAHKSGNLPSAIDVYGAGNFDAAAAAAWQSALTVPVHLVGAYDWRTCTSRDARNLLGGEFAPPRQPREGWGAWRPALLLSALFIVIYSAYSFGEWIWLGHQHSLLQQEITDNFRAVAPQQPIQNPSLQMQRLYDQLRRERGQLGSADFLPLLAVVSEVAGSLGNLNTLRSIGYDDGRLEFSMRMNSVADAERLRDAMTRRGFTAILRDTHAAPGGAGIEVQFAVRGTT
ncbi:MAG TPA: type II secretion system protein GspL [Rhodocyclaceae bacterium]|nr:type II secretion system protein GspL [Rhodocyclaceae bacterium]